MTGPLYGDYWGLDLRCLLSPEKHEMKNKEISAFQNKNLEVFTSARAGSDVMMLFPASQGHRGGRGPSGPRPAQW